MIESPDRLFRRARSRNHLHEFHRLDIPKGLSENSAVVLARTADEAQMLLRIGGRRYRAANRCRFRDRFCALKSSRPIRTIGVEANVAPLTPADERSRIRIVIPDFSGQASRCPGNV